MVGFGFGAGVGAGGGGASCPPWRSPGPRGASEGGGRRRRSGAARPRLSVCLSGRPPGRLSGRTHLPGPRLLRAQVPAGKEARSGRSPAASPGRDAEGCCPLLTAPGSAPCCSPSPSLPASGSHPAQGGFFFNKSRAAHPALAERGSVLRLTKFAPSPLLALTLRMKKDLQAKAP